jgi:5'-nucleotidase
VNNLPEIKIISFDVEGTLASPDFSTAVWYEGIPTLYARQYNLSFAEALAEVKKAYAEVGDGRREWYDIKYWFRRFQLGDYRPIMETCRAKATHYPEVRETLNRLSPEYTLIATSGSAREFLEYLLDGSAGSFKRVFSSISDYGQVKTPQFYLTVCREMGVEPGEILHIGDSWRFDVLAAQEAGVRALFLDRGQAPGKDDSLFSLREVCDWL